MKILVIGGGGREHALVWRLSLEAAQHVIFCAPGNAGTATLSTNLPIAAYQVSGEYAQLHAAAEKGWLDLRATRDESLLAIRRAGADVILSYFAEAYARDFAARK